MDEILATEKAGSSSQTSAAFVQLRSDILNGVLKPGERLRIGFLAKRYGLGPTPIREALMLLTSGALIERIDQRGFSVRPITLEEFDELHKTRRWIEDIALRQSMAAATPAWHEQLVLAAWRLNRAERSAGGENNQWDQLHKSFHRLLVSNCGSRFLLATCDELFDLNTRYRQAARHFERRQRDVAAEHNAIVDAVIAGDPDQAVGLLMDHYGKTAEYLRSSLNDSEVG